jgi:hypothetical protein
MLSKFLDLKEKIYKNQKVSEEVDDLLDLLLENPKIEEIVIFKGLVNLTGDGNLKKRISKITNLIKFPLKKVRNVDE